VRAFTRFIGLDVHEVTTSICVRSREGAILEETVIPTNAMAIRRFFPKRRATWTIAFEESTLAQWLYEPRDGAGNFSSVRRRSGVTH
jgi:hypothetical protein